MSNWRWPGKDWESEEMEQLRWKMDKIFGEEDQIIQT